MVPAEIIAIGSELLLGGRSDTNSVFLSEMLLVHGIEVRFKSVVGDDVRTISQALTVAARRAKVVLVTGGLGPTVDDLTREAVSHVMGVELRRREKVWKAMKERFLQQGRAISHNQRRQAYLPVGADYLHNAVGTAPGFSVQWRGCRFFCLPGVSHEAKHMFSDSVVPLLCKAGNASLPIQYRVIHTYGIMEGTVDEYIAGIVSPTSGIRVGMLASPLGVSVSLTSAPPKKADSRDSASEEVYRVESKVKLEKLSNAIALRLGTHVYGYDDMGMEVVVGKQLSASGSTLALAESCTGGLIGHRLTNVPGSSGYLERGLICYSNRSKIDLLGVSETTLRKFGAVSTQVAREMARGIRKRSKTTLGLSVTGIAGPSGGTSRKPVGLVYVGLAAPDGVFARKFRFPGDRETIKLRASQGALDMVRRYLANLPVLE